jgi:hypothetical protein
LDYTSCLTLSLNDFLNHIKNHDENYQKYFSVKDQILFANKKDKINPYCYICQENFHSEKNCQLLCFNPNKEILNLK